INYLVCGFLCGLAVLAKGVCALGIFGTLFFIFYHEYKSYISRRPEALKNIALICVMVLVPILMFTVLHYHQEGFLFWKRYLFREAIEQTLDNPGVLTL